MFSPYTLFCISLPLESVYQVLSVSKSVENRVTTSLPMPSLHVCTSTHTLMLHTYSTVPRPLPLCNVACKTMWVAIHAPKCVLYDRKYTNKMIEQRWQLQVDILSYICFQVVTDFMKDIGMSNPNTVHWYMYLVTDSLDRYWSNGVFKLHKW